MTRHVTGYLGLLAALGMMAGLLSPEVAALDTWASAFSPVFVSKVLAHLAAVVGAFVAGKIIPTE